jgi:aerotaxis receptor
MLEYTNIKTGNIVKREAPKDVSIPYFGKTMILETDTDGYIIYANKRFVETSGYEKEELIGLPHCMHMHPEMPENIFKDACQMTSSGKTWNGYIKNITKEGTAYWTEISIQPKFCEEDKITGFMAIRREPEHSELENVMAEYKKLNSSESSGEKSQYCGEVYMGRGSCNF